MPTGVLNGCGAQVVEDAYFYHVQLGLLHSISYKYADVDVAAGADFLIDVPSGTRLHWKANYYSKFGGFIDASYAPSVTSLGTEIVPINCRTELPKR